MFFNYFNRKDINQGVEDWKNTKDAVLLDVRTKEEYNDYHIEGSTNIPLDNLDTVNQKIPNKNTAIFVHCLSGARSADATRYLVSQGYNNVKDIGGINAYTGEIVSCNISYHF